MTQYTTELGTYAARLRFEDIPPSVVENVKTLILDTIGCGLYGAKLKPVQVLASTVRALGSEGPVTVWGHGFGAAASEATLVNAAAVQSFELDDIHASGRLHCGSSVLVPVLAAAELRPAISGRDLVTAVVAGIEVGVRVGHCLRHRPQLAGFHVPNLTGSVAAAAGVGKALGLNSSELAQAIGHAAVTASGLGSFLSLGMSKYLAAGWCAKSGLYAAFLAAEGLAGVTDMLERPQGFVDAFTQLGRPADLSDLVEGLGERFFSDAIVFKLYSCRGPIHTTLDALRELAEQHRFSPKDIEAIDVRLADEGYVQAVGSPFKRDTSWQAQLSLAYSAAVLLAEGEAFIEQYSDEKVADPALAELARRIATAYDPALRSGKGGTPKTAAVTVRMRDGNTLTAIKNNPDTAQGGAKVRARLRAKFYRILGSACPKERLDRIVETVSGLDGLGDVKDLATMLGAPP